MQAEQSEFRLNKVKVIDLHRMGLPEIFGCSIHQRNDLKFKKYSAAFELEQLRDVLNARLSVSTSTWNICEIYKKIPKFLFLIKKFQIILLNSKFII